MICLMGDPFETPPFRTARSAYGSLEGSLTSSIAQVARPFMRWAIEAARLSWLGLRGLPVILLRGMIVTRLKEQNQQKNIQMT